MAALLTAGACSEDRADEASGGGDRRREGSTPPTSAECEGDGLLDCARASTIGDSVPDEATKADGEPLVIGMMNQENTPVGSFPELSQAVRAGVDFVNDQLGGVDGRPIELDVCNTEFSPEGSTACAQRFVQAGVPAVLGGIDVFGTGIETLADNEIPYVGGIPVSDQSMTSPNSYQWSGGTWGASVGFAAHAAEDGAERVAIIYGEFGPITEGAEYGKRTLEALGVDQVQLVPYPVVSTDLTSPMQAAAAGDPDAVFVLTADTGCKGSFDAVETVGLDAQIYYTGACASPAIVESVDASRTDGALFNVEGEINRDEPDPDSTLYLAVSDRYGPDGFNPIGAGTVSFRSFMNLYSVLGELDEITPAAITASLRAKVDAPSFMGHPYTCDGEQLEGLPAACSPQQVLARMQDQELTQVGTWIDVGEVYGKA